MLDTDKDLADDIKYIRDERLKTLTPEQRLEKLNAYIRGLNTWGTYTAATLVEEAENVEYKKAQAAYDAAIATKSEDGNDSSTSLGANDW
jgi:hypothetical protein